MTGNSAARGPFPVMVKQAHDTLIYPSLGADEPKEIV